MNDVEITFHCMCFFVPDEKERTVHVLMPSTDGHHPPTTGKGSRGRNRVSAAGGIPKHTVRLRYKGSSNTGIEMEGWSIALGGEPGDAITNLQFPDSNQTDYGDGELVDLSGVLDDQKIDPKLLTADPGNAVASRITLSTGKLDRLEAEALWDLNGREDLALAHKAVWCIPNFSDGPLAWKRRRLNAGAESQEEDLAAARPDRDGVIRIEIFHVLPQALPSRGKPPWGQPDIEITRHFGALYRLFGIREPPANLLPVARKVPKSFTVNCAAARGSL